MPFAPAQWPFEPLGILSLLNGHGAGWGGERSWRRAAHVSGLNWKEKRNQVKGEKINSEGKQKREIGEGWK